MFRDTLVTVVVPVYNQERFLGETLHSIRQQTYSNLEILLVDDGSTDGTHQILLHNKDEDSRISIIYQHHQLAGVARNRGLDAAQGKYIIFLDSDDLFESDMIARMVAQAEKYKSDVVLCKADALCEDGSHQSMPHQLCLSLLPANIDVNDFSIARDVPHLSFQLVCGWAWDKLFRTDYLRKYEFRFGHTRHAEDALLAFPATLFASHASIVAPNEPLVHYRQSNNQLSSSQSMANAPLSFFEIADRMYNKLRMLKVSEPVISSMKIWFAVYSCWSIQHMGSIAWVDYVRAVRSRLEPRYKITKCIRECALQCQYAGVFRACRESLSYYIAVSGGICRIPRKCHWFSENRECYGVLGKSIYSITYGEKCTVHRMMGKVIKKVPVEEFA